MVDIHTHILYGWDDGARTLEDSLEMARIAAEDGITIMAATPHAYWQGGPISGCTIFEGVAEINAALEKKEIPVRVVPGAEVPMDRNLPERLLADPDWTYTGQGIYMLLEPPWGSLPSYCFTMIEELLDQGITPVIAHPERSPDLQSNPAIVGRMVEMGCLAQVTAASILARTGTPVKKVADRLLTSGWAHVISSDAHNTNSRPPRLSEARAQVVEMLGEEHAQRLFEENPAQILNGGALRMMPGAGQRATDKPGGIGSLFRRMLRR